MPPFTACLALAAAAFAADVPASTDRIEGLLELPGLLGAAVPVYPQPGTKVPSVLTLRSDKDLALEEYAYEERGAVVVGLGQGWYRIRLREGTGWVSAGDAGAFHPYEKLVQGAMSYLTPAWDGRFWGKPGKASTAKRTSVAADPADNRPVDVLEARRAGHELWLRVRLLSHRCEAVKPKVLGEGWVPGYAPSGEPTVWFLPRGC